MSNASSIMVGLDDAQALPPRLPKGNHVLVAAYTEVYSAGGATHYSVVGSVEKTDNSTVRVGSKYSVQIPFLSGGRYPGSNDKAKRLLKEFLASILGADPDGQPPEGFGSWSELGAKTIDDSKALAGDRFGVNARPKNGSDEYCVYNFLPVAD
jgi:hypothetical protein